MVRALGLPLLAAALAAAPTAPAGRGGEQRTGSIRGRVELLRPPAAVERRPTVNALGAPPRDVIDRVRLLNLKKNLKQDAECQTLEDALCLVFLEHQFASLAAKTTEEKLLAAVRKSWDKMSDAGRAAALALPLPPTTREMVQRALAGR